MNFEEAREKIRNHTGPALDLSGHYGPKLEKLPTELADLKDLVSLDLSDNGLKTLPGWFPQLTNLQTLDLSDNRLKTLPGWFPQLTNLQTLDFSGNELETLPDGFGQLTNLQTLDLRDIRLKTLPDWFPQFTNLQTLDLGSNILKTLPGGFGQLTNLHTLNLLGNNLKTLPDGFGQLTNLQTLDLRINPLDIPGYFTAKELDQHAIQELFTYLQNRHQDPHPKATFQIPKELRTAFKQYFLYFKDFLDSFEGVTVGLEVASTEDGLEIILEGATEQDFDKINHYLARFLSLIKENASKLTAEGVGELEVIRLRNQVRSLQTELEIANYKVKYLEGQQRDDKAIILQLASGNQTVTLSPNIHVTVDAHAQAEAHSKAILEAELPNLQDAFAYLKQFLPAERKTEAAQLHEDLKQLTPATSQKEIIESGVLPCLNRFINSAKDANSGLANAIKAGEKGAESFQKLGRAYNSIAQWVGLPQVPAPFLGKGD